VAKGSSSCLNEPALKRPLGHLRAEPGVSSPKRFCYADIVFGLTTGPALPHPAVVAYEVVHHSPYVRDYIVARHLEFAPGTPGGNIECIVAPSAKPFLDLQEYLSRERRDPWTLDQNDRLVRRAMRGGRQARRELRPASHMQPTNEGWPELRGTSALREAIRNAGCLRSLAADLRSDEATITHPIQESRERRRDNPLAASRCARA
jgi:hypothetical protein